MAEKLTDKLVKALPAPPKSNRITYDSEVSGFGIRVTAAGARSFVLNYRRKADALDRRRTIGSFPDWTAGAARDEARRLKRLIDGGSDPVGENRAHRDAATVADLCDRFAQEFLPRLRPASARDYGIAIRKYIKPALGRHKVASVTHGDIAALHRRITTSASYQANHSVALLSRLFNLAIRWNWRADNPAKGIERNQETKRHRYLSADELARLTVALAEHPAAGREHISATAINRRASRRGAEREMGRPRSRRWRLGEARRDHQTKNAAPRSALRAGTAAPRRFTSQSRPV